MPLHDYIKQIYKEVNDPQYIIRFLDYLIGKTNRRTTFTVKGHSVEPLITGVLQDTKTKERYYSLAQFYNNVTGANVGETDTTIFKNINVTSGYTLWRIVCTMTEKDILEFFDQKYRSFLMYRDARKRIKYYTSVDTNDKVTLMWGDEEFVLSHTKLECPKSPQRVYEMLEAYEDGFIEGLYYCGKDGRKLITDS
jgi:hypothetical protein